MLNTCQQCGEPAAGRYCDACAVWFAATPTRVEPVWRQVPPASPVTLHDPSGPARPSGSRRPGTKAIGIGLTVVVAGIGTGLVLMLLGGGESPDAAAPAATHTPIVTTTPTPTPKPTPSSAPVTVVTITATPPAVEEDPVGEPLGLGAPPQEFDRFYPLGRGDRGHVVEALQALLTRKGVDTYIDGDFGAATERSVRQWQARQGLSVTGIVDDTTWESLTPDLELGSSGAAVSVLQKLLNDRGHPVVVDGDFGTQTRDAVLSFQADRGLVVDGMVGAQTWPALLA